jgi:hypothetical protein
MDFLNVVVTLHEEDPQDSAAKRKIAEFPRCGG